MVTVECTNVGLSTMYKAAVSKGLSYHVFMVYSYAISALLLLPLSYFFHRRTQQLPPFTFQLHARQILHPSDTRVYLQHNILAGYKGIELSNPTLGSAMHEQSHPRYYILSCNSFQVYFLMEKVKWKSISSQAKTIGTVVSMGGAFIVVFYKGPMLLNISSAAVESNWFLGGSLLAASYIVVSIWYIFQAKFVREYPAEFLVLVIRKFACLSSVIIYNFCFV
ncbi:hypothetical protein ACJIZ3_011581 [Penstemon smallii]|uniref:WAT1-related protein n=1 Tax=Penstemon smallii TaxID=265156 RepID=A0ABD3UJJ1_9LAMI